MATFKWIDLDKRIKAQSGSSRAAKNRRLAWPVTPCDVLVHAACSADALINMLVEQYAICNNGLFFTVIF